MNRDYKQHYKHIKDKNNDWFISVNTTTAGSWSIEYVYDPSTGSVEQIEPEIYLEEELFEI